MKKKAKKAKPSTAMVRVTSRPQIVLPPLDALDAMRQPRPATPVPLEVQRITDETMLGTLGLSEMKLTKQEEKVLSRAVNIEDVRVKPNGLAYLSHPSYTRWFNEAFGRLGWTVVPAGKPVKTDRGVARDYLLYVHGRAVAFATGEQDYMESNKEQSWGDALEATVASAIRRFAKRLGVSLELWDKPWLGHYLADHCVRVLVVKRGEKVTQWRRKVDMPFDNEVGKTKDQPQGDRDFEPRSEQRPVPQQPTQPGAADEQLITRGTRQRPGQLERLWAIIKNSGRNEQSIRDWLHTRYHYDSTRSIKRKDYDAICRAIEAKEALQ